jgi:prevent-host-death family protein
MITAGVKELKNHLSKYLTRVKSGEEILITDRGKTFARIVKEEASNKSIRSALAPLIAKGLIKLPSREINKRNLSPIQVPGKPVSEMVLEDRR